MAKSFELKGYYVAMALVVLTGIVGMMFIVLGPQATERSPGVLHVGIRYVDENSIGFSRFPKSGPGALLEFLNSEGSVVYQMADLKIGRNLVPIESAQLPNGHYTARLSAPEYQATTIPVVVEGRMLNPVKGSTLTAGTLADYNMLGVRLRPIE